MSTNLLPLQRISHDNRTERSTIQGVILLHEKFLQFDWLRAVGISAWPWYGQWIPCFWQSSIDHNMGVYRQVKHRFQALKCPSTKMFYFLTWKYTLLKELLRKNLAIWTKDDYFRIFLKHSNLPPFWHTIRLSLFLEYDFYMTYFKEHVTLSTGKH